MAEVTDDRLRLIFERAERLEEEKKGIADDLRDVWGEAKAVGYDTKIAKQAYRLWKMKPDDRRQMEALLDTYKAALGMDYGPLFAGLRPDTPAPEPAGDNTPPGAAARAVALSLGGDVPEVCCDD